MALSKSRQQSGVTGDKGVLELDRDGRALSDRYGALDPNALYQSLKRYLAALSKRIQSENKKISTADIAAIEGASTHWLRHFFAKSATADGVLVTALRDMMGHEDLSTTGIYTSTDDEVLVREMSKIRRRI